MIHVNLWHITRHVLVNTSISSNLLFYSIICDSSCITVYEGSMNINSLLPDLSLNSFWNAFIWNTVLHYTEPSPAATSYIGPSLTLCIQNPSACPSAEALPVTITQRARLMEQLLSHTLLVTVHKKERERERDLDGPIPALKCSNSEVTYMALNIIH